jgi:hypothetical protein
MLKQRLVVASTFLFALLLALITRPSFIVASFVAGDAQPASISTPEEQAVNSSVNFVSRIGGTIGKVFVVEPDLLIFGAGPNLYILDRSSPLQLTLISAFPLPDTATHVALQGEYAYVTAGSAGLRVLDISDVSEPIEIAHYDTPGLARSVTIAGLYAYVADGSQGLRIIDIGDPYNPSEVGHHLTAGDAHSVAVAGGHAYVAGGPEGLRILDITNPSSPTEIGAYVTPGSARDLTVAGPYVYIADLQGGLRVVDISEPSSPDEIGFFTESGLFASNVVVTGGYAYLSGGEKGFYILDVSVPTIPIKVSAHKTPGAAQYASLIGNHAYVADTNSVRVLDVTDLGNNVEVSAFEAVGLPIGITVDHNFAYIANIGGLALVDIADTAFPVATGFYSSPEFALRVAVAENHAYIADSVGGLRIVNVSNPAEPYEVSNFYSDWNIRDVAIDGSYAFVAQGGFSDAGLRVLDISEQAAPFEAGFLQLPGGAEHIQIVGSYAYVSSGFYFWIADITVPSNPSVVGYYQAPDSAHAAQQFAVAGNYAYVGTNANNLLIMDLSDPPNPALAAIYNTQQTVRSVAAEGNYLYVLQMSSLRVLDISSPVNPIEVGSYSPLNNARHIRVLNGNIFIGEDGLLILRHAPTSLVAPENVAVSGPIFGLVGTEKTFTAVVSPNTATTPLVFAWNVTDQAPQSSVGGLSDEKTFTWSSSGIKSVSVTAGGIAGSATTSVTVNIGDAIETVYPESEGSLVYTNAQGHSTSLVIPVGAVNEPTTLLLSVTDAPSAPPPAGYGLIPYAFRLDAYQSDGIQSGFSFNQPALLSLTYDEAEVIGLNEDSLLVFYWNFADQTWQDAATTCEPISEYLRQPGQLSVEICRTGHFALFAQELARLYLPIVIR